MNRCALGLMLAFLAAPSWGLTVWGVDINGLEIQTSYWSIQNAVEDSGVSPLVNTVGASVPFRFLGHWVFRPEVQIFFVDYAYQDNRAVPMDSMWDHVTILSLMINPAAGYEFSLGPDLSWVVEGGLGFLARFPVFLAGTTAGEMALPATGWLLAGRLVYPNLGAGITWQFSPLFAATLRGQLFYPIFNLWEGLPWYDQLTYGLGLGVRFTF